MNYQRWSNAPFDSSFPQIKNENELSNDVFDPILIADSCNSRAGIIFPFTKCINGIRLYVCISVSLYLNAAILPGCHQPTAQSDAIFRNHEICIVNFYNGLMRDFFIHSLKRLGKCICVEQKVKATHCDPSKLTHLYVDFA